MKSTPAGAGAGVLKFDEAAKLIAGIFKKLTAAELGKLDKGDDTDDIAAEFADEIGGGFEGTAGGNQVVDYDDGCAKDDGVFLDLQGVFAVFFAVGDGNGFAGKLAGFAGRDETPVGRPGDLWAEKEAASFGADNVAVFAGIGNDAHDLIGEVG